MRTLCLSGGGSRGAFQVGAINWLMGHLGIQYDLIVGNSTGAINGAAVSQFIRGQESAAAEYLDLHWRALRTPDVVKPWAPWFLGSVIGYWKGGLLNPAPLKRMLWTQYAPERTRASGRKLVVTTVDIQSGHITAIDSAAADDETMRRGIFASAAFPEMMPPVAIGDSWHIDGGLRSVAPLDTALKFGATQIDVIATYPAQFRAAKPKRNLVGLGKRYLSIMMDEIMQNDLELGLNGARVRVIRPARYIDQNPLEWNPDEIRRAIDYGYELARYLAPGP